MKGCAASAVGWIRIETFYWQKDYQFDLTNANNWDLKNVQHWRLYGQPPHGCKALAPKLYGWTPSRCTASARIVWLTTYRMHIIGTNCMVDHLMETQPWRQLYAQPPNGCTAPAPITWSTTRMVEQEWRLLFDKNSLHVMLTTFDLFYSVWILMSLGAFYGAVVLLRMATRFSMWNEIEII